MDMCTCQSSRRVVSARRSSAVHIFESSTTCGLLTTASRYLLSRQQVAVVRRLPPRRMGPRGRTPTGASGSRRYASDRSDAWHYSPRTHSRVAQRWSCSSRRTSSRLPGLRSVCSAPTLVGGTVGTKGKARRNDGRHRKRKPKLPVEKAPTMTLADHFKTALGWRPSQRPFHTSANREGGGCRAIKLRHPERARPQPEEGS
jgi:hypothetical protein